jgi:hypothetical protein
MRSMIGLSALGMLCWLVMFLAGTDVWHFAGSPDFWRLAGPPYTDLRAFGYAFYLQFLILLTMIAFTSWTALKAVRSGKLARGREELAHDLPTGGRRLVRW